MPDIQDLEGLLDRPSRVLDTLARIALKLTECRQAGLVRGTDSAGRRYLPPEDWDRGRIDIIKKGSEQGSFAASIVRNFVFRKCLPQIPMYSEDERTARIQEQGIISHVLRMYADYYEMGIRILIIRDLKGVCDGIRRFSDVSLPIVTYDGKSFQFLPGLSVTVDIVKRFNADNFLAAYIPDYGALVLNTIDPKLLETGPDHGYPVLRARLDLLIRCIERASITLLTSPGNKGASKMLLKKENRLRRTAVRLSEKERELERQRKYLRAVGAATESQLEREPVLVHAGVYSFVDMKGSACLREEFSSLDYFMITNFCRRIAADLACRWHCRLGNFIGDGLFFQCAFPFDAEGLDTTPRINERSMLMTFLIRSYFREIRSLIQGRNSLDAQGRVARLLAESGQTLSFRAGIEVGPATVGPVGSDARMMVTAIGEGVDTAARLEATGNPDTIHVGNRLYELLTSSRISRETPLVLKALARDEVPAGGVSFWEMYSRCLMCQGPMIKERRNVRYKEFCPEKTWELSW